jgi:hypothetical protein
MQEGNDERQSVLDALNFLSSKGAIFVYSTIHIDECRDSDQPEAFVAIIEDISAHYLEHSSAAETQIALSPNRARGLILAEPDLADEAARLMAESLKLLQFTQGWLGDVEAKALKEEIIEGIGSFWKSLENELPREMLDLLANGKDEMLKYIRDMPLEQLRGEGLESGRRLREKLPKNYAQLDEMPDDEVADYLISCLDENDQAAIRKRYPPLFWADFKTREEGDLTGFAFLQFLMGLVRENRAKKRDQQRRAKYFRTQFQDCRHIETASRCAVFVTFDKGAARLAKAVFAYAGVRTEVVHLEVHRA